MSITIRNEAPTLWEEYDNVAYFVGAAYASPQEEARLAELKVLILAAERRATVERIRVRLERIGADLPIGTFGGVYLVLDEEAAR